MSNLTPDTARAASYLATRERMDFRGKGPKCNPPNRQCGDRCIPPNWKCRVKGEGTDSHSRVVAGDPLAGAAAIQRGQARLRKGFKSGNLADIQGGRAAIERGIVKAVPGQNIKQKQALRKSINKVLLPAATAVFGVWALQRGHQGLKLIPQYRNGVGRQIEESVSSGISWGLDRLPVLGPQRLEQRRRAGLEAQRIGRAVSRSITRDPAQPENNSQYYRLLSQKNRGSFTGLDTAIQSVYGEYKGGNGKYENFRSDVMAGLIGAKGADGKSLYAEAAAANYLARQFSIDPNKLINSNGVESRFHTESQINSAFLMARSTMRSDMEMRGLDPRNTNDVERYVKVALGGAKPWMAGLPEADQRNATERFSGYVRDLVARGKTLKEEKTTRQKAAELFDEAEKQFDKYFKDFSQTVRENTAPTTRVIASGNAGDAVRTALIGAADRVKRDVGLDAGYRVMGANHAELILQKAYFEKAQPGNYNGRARSTWLAGDSDIRYAAQDMGWEGRNLDEAVEFLRANGFARLERRPAAPARQTPRTATNPTGAARSARRVSDAQRIAAMLRRKNPDGTPVFATREAAEAELRRMKRRDAEDTFAPELARTAIYLAARADFKEGGRLGKPCGASHIPKAHECRKGQGASTPESGQGNTAAKVALAAGVAVGAAALASNPKLRQRARVEARLILKGSDNVVREALKLGGRGAVAGLSAKQVKEGLSKLPEALQGPARKLVGAAKQGAASTALKAEGYSIQDIDVVNNFSTWKNKKGTLISIGSYGDSLVTYASDNSHSWNGKRVYKIGFNVDQNFDATRDIPTTQARGITAAVRKMTDNHLSKIKDGVLATFPWDGDDYGAKRRAIYSRAGFNNIVGEESQWALVSNGRIKKMTSAESFVFLAESGERDAPIYKPTKRERKDALGRPDGRR